jgi:hypothetical protein
MLSFVGDHRGRDSMVGGFTQSVSITIHAVSSNTSQCEVYSIQHFQQYQDTQYLIKSPSQLQYLGPVKFSNKHI